MTNFTFGMLFFNLLFLFHAKGFSHQSPTFTFALRLLTPKDCNFYFPELFLTKWMRLAGIYSGVNGGRDSGTAFAPLLISTNRSQRRRILSSKDPWTTMWLLLYKFIILLSLYEKIFVKSWQNSALNLPGRTPVISVAVQQMSQQRMCHWVCYLIIHICCIWGHIWNRHRCSQPCPKEALTLCGCDSATFLNYLLVAGDFKIEILSAAFYPKWWKASKKHHWDILLLALWHWAFITINKLWYLRAVFWGISYKATGQSLQSLTHVSFFKSNGSPHAGWTWGGLFISQGMVAFPQCSSLSPRLHCLGTGVTGLLSSHWVNGAWHQVSAQFKGGKQQRPWKYGHRLRKVSPAQLTMHRWAITHHWKSARKRHRRRLLLL